METESQLLLRKGLKAIVDGRPASEPTEGLELAPTQLRAATWNTISMRRAASPVDGLVDLRVTGIINLTVAKHLIFAVDGLFQMHE